MNNTAEVRNPRAVLAALLACACASLAFGARFVDEHGQWPDSWPDELEPLRARAKTYEFSAGMQEQSYVIPFKNRDEFERVWPALLSVATPGAPITLVSSPVKYWDSDTPLEAGVEIYKGRSRVAITTSSNGRQELFELEAPWPDRFYMEDGKLYSHAVFDFDNKRWVPRTPESEWGVGFRIRTEVKLIVDDRAIDISRIEFREGVTIIDNRKESSDSGQPAKTKNSEHARVQRRASPTEID